MRLAHTNVNYAVSYHLAGFYYFAAGLALRTQLLLFASFLASRLLYLWTENLIRDVQNVESAPHSNTFCGRCTLL